MGFDGFETRATQQISGVANGGEIGISSSSSNAARNISSTNARISGTKIQPGEVHGYIDLTQSLQRAVSTIHKIDLATGDEIHLSSSASNRENDRANVNMHAIGNGYITNYLSHPTATAGAALASNSFFNDSDPSPRGNRIEIDATASDGARNSASVSTLVLDGYVAGGIINSASSRSVLFPRQLVNQLAINVSGSEIKIDAKAINAAKEKKSLSTLFVNPVDISYENFAAVQAGNLTVSQGPIS